MRFPIFALIAVCLCLLGVQFLHAQPPADDHGAPDVAQDQGQEDTARPPTAAPGEEVMRPTERGLRMTPDLARALSRSFVLQLTENTPLTDDQKTQLNAAMARRIMETARVHQDLAQHTAEYLCEAVMKKELGDHQFTPQDAREFSARMLPALPIIREFIRGTLDDFAPVLDAAQREAIREMTDEAMTELDKIEARMNRWSNGEYQPGEDPFDDRSPDSRPAARPGEPPPSPELQGAEERVKWTLRTLEPSTWERFVVIAGRYFSFSPEQTAQSRRILADYRAKADAVMTPQWKQRVRENRLKQQFRDILNREQPVAPWFFHLQHEFELAIRPLTELGIAFRKEVLALATPEQRDAAFADLRRRAESHGLILEPSDLSLLGLAAE